MPLAGRQMQGLGHVLFGLLLLGTGLPEQAPEKQADGQVDVGLGEAAGPSVRYLALSIRAIVGNSAGT